jgi:hypothetical protein
MAQTQSAHGFSYSARVTDADLDDLVAWLHTVAPKE